jgi:hypothetical protein
MKQLIKIAIFTGLIVFVSSCQKEELPTFTSCPSHQENSAGQRVSETPDPNGDPNTNPNDIVGGSDDDRDGGGGERRTIYTSGSDASTDSIHAYDKGDEGKDPDVIVGGGDDDRDGDGGGKKGKKTGG